jgi:molecular chaperone IbpA
MRNFDPAPLWQSTVGFDHPLDLIDNSLRLAGENNYPPYNIDAVRDLRLSYVA